MNVAKVVGNVWATVKNKNLEGEKLLLIQAIELKSRDRFGRIFAAVDTVRAGVGDTVIYVTSREATLPLKDPFTPVDAAIVGLVDRIDLATE